MRIFLRIAAPLARPALTVSALQAILWRWNSLLEPLICLTKRGMWTLALGVNGRREFEGGTDWTHCVMVLAASVVVPAVTICFWAQHAFAQGVVLTELKGCPLRRSRCGRPAFLVLSPGATSPAPHRARL